MSATDETQDDKLARIDALIEASSLGAPAARSPRTRTLSEFAAELVAAARLAKTVEQPPAAPREMTQPTRRRHAAASFDEVFWSTRLRLLELQI